MRITLRSGTVAKFDDATLNGDSLVWFEERPFKLTRQRAGSIPVSDIAKVEIRRLDVGGSAAAGAGGAVVAAAAAVGIVYLIAIVAVKRGGGGVW